MATRTNYQSITLYKDMAPQVLELTESEAGMIYQAIFRYTCYGEDTDFSQYDRFIRSLWETTKMKLQAGEDHNKQISETNRNNVMKRWNKEKCNTDEYERKQTNTDEYERTTYTITDTGTNSVTPTISSTVTNTEQDSNFSASVDRRSDAAAAKADPLVGDLFSTKQITAISKKNKVDLTSEGIQVFYEEMQESGWILYNKKVEKKGITRALRAWAKYHPEYAQNLDDKEPKQQPKLEKKEPEFDSNNPEMVKEWLREEFGDLKKAKKWVLENYGSNAFEELGIKEEEFL